MSRELYTVFADGHRNCYGAALYLVGVFTDKEEANRVAYKITSEKHLYTAVLPVKENTEYKLTKNMDLDEDYANENYLGGYSE